MIKRDSQVSSPICDFTEDQMWLDIKKTLSSTALDSGKANEKSTNFRMFSEGKFFV